jgi:outer membrane cobalamin receptor
MPREPFGAWKRRGGLMRVCSLLLAGCLLALVVPSLSAEPVTGTVRGPDGLPIPSARVVVEHPSGAVHVTYTRLDGTFDADVPSGGYLVRVLAAGLVADVQPVEVAPSAGASLDVRMRLAAVSEAVVVSASQVPQTRSGLGTSLTVIDEEELRTRQVESTVDALRSVPGLTVSRSGGRGSVTSLFPRGGESDFTLVLVDGIRLNDLGGAFDAAHLPLFDLQQIEVVRGPQSATYGSDAIGGVVQLVTRRGGPPRAEGVVEGGSFGTTRANVTAAGSLGRLRAGAGVERLASDGFTGTAPGTGETVSNDDYRRTDATLSLGYDDRRWQATGLVRVGQNTRGVPGPFGSDPGGTFGGVDRVSRGDNETVALGGSVAYTVSPALQARAQGTFADRDSTFVSIYSPDTPTASANRLVTGRGQLDGAISPTLSWSAGAEVARERASSAFITETSGAPVDVARSLAGLFAEGRVTRGRISLQAGVRAERISRDALAGNADPWQPRPPFAVDVVTSVNPRASISVGLRERGSSWTRLRANAGTGIRPPGAFEIAFTDNPGLKPERSRSLDAGIEQGWLDGRLVVDAAVFWNRYDDLIVTVGRSLADASRYISDNISNARTRGLETTLAARPTRAVTARAGYVWLSTAILAVDGTGVAPAPFSVGDRLLRRPTHSGFMDVLLQTGRVSGFFRVDGRGRALDIDPSVGASGGLYDTSAYASADAGLAFAVHPRVQANLRVTNLFDRQYEEILGFPAPRRAVMVGVRVAAGR